MSLSRAILVFLIFCFIGQIIYYYPNLPEKMASHFNALGEPDGWMQKSTFLIFESVILFLIIAEFTILPWWIQKMPKDLINLPNKDYWLSEERSSETFSYIRTFFEWFGIGLLGLFIAVNELVFRANLTKHNVSIGVWIPLVIFLVFVVGWLIKFFFRFKKPL